MDRTVEFPQAAGHLAAIHDVDYLVFMGIKLLHQLIELTRSLRNSGDLSADCKK
jgi:hypothetical protein